MPTFLITVTVPCDTSEYVNTAGEIVNSLQLVTTDTEQMTGIIGAFEDASVEVGVKFEDEQAVARAAVRFTAEGKPTFDKTKFTAALRATGLADFKLRKQAISDDLVLQITKAGQSSGDQE